MKRSHQQFSQMIDREQPIFAYPEELDHHPVFHEYEQPKIRYVREYGRSTSDQFDKLIDINNFKMMLAYLVSDVFVHRKTEKRLFDYLFNRLRQAFKDAKRYDSGDKNRLLAFIKYFTVAITPLYFKCTLPTEVSRFDTFCTTDCFFINEVMTQTSDNLLCYYECNFTSSYPEILEMVENNQFEALDAWFLAEFGFPSVDALRLICIAHDAYARIPAEENDITAGFKKESLKTKYSLYHRLGTSPVFKNARNKKFVLACMQ